MASEAAEALLAEIASLEASWSELAAAVAAASRDLAEGRPPAAGLEAALAEARRAYLRIQQAVAELAGAAGAEGLSALRRQVEVARRRDAVTRLLQRVLAAPGEALAAPRRAAAQLLEALSRNADEMQALAEGRHPLADLVRLLDDDPDADPVAWDQSYRAVADAYGAAAAVAAFRLRSGARSPGGQQTPARPDAAAPPAPPTAAPPGAAPEPAPPRASGAAHGLRTAGGRSSPGSPSCGRRSERIPVLPPGEPCQRRRSAVV